MKESQTLEFKKSLAERREILETISAFSNAKGGEIIVGIEENKDGSIKEIVGIEIRGKEIENLTNEIKQNTDPVIFPSVEIKEMEEKEVISIEVEESPFKPVFTNGDAFKRVGKTNKRLTSEEIRKLARDSVGFNITELVCKEATLSDISKEKLRDFLITAKAERGFDANPDAPVKENLERLKLLKGEKLLNAAILLFGKNPEKFFLQARMRCARFKGVDSHDYIDMKVFDGTIRELREKAIKFIMQHTKHGVFFDSNGRYDKWEYPFRALEEAFSNALVHRTYDTNAEIQVSIYDDRIGIWNPGKLPKGLHLSDLKKRHHSVPRNRLLAETLFLPKFIEKWGEGTNRIIKEMKDHGLEEPKFEHLSGGFEITLIGPGKEFEKEIEKAKLGVLDINDRQKKAIEYLNKYGKITSKIYQEINNLGKVYSIKELNDMCKKNILLKTGKGKNIKYKFK